MADRQYDVIWAQLRIARARVAELEALVRAADIAFRAGPVMPIRWAERVAKVLGATEPPPKKDDKTEPR